MGWLNLAATRFYLRSGARDLLAKWTSTGKAPIMPSSPAIYSLMAGDPVMAKTALALSTPLVEQYGRYDGETLLNPLILSHAAAFFVVASLGGVDTAAWWRKIASAKARQRDPVTAGLQEVARRLSQSAASTVKPKPVRLRRGLVESAAEWLRLLSSAPAAYLLDQALCPDHRLWASLLKPFVLPLGLLAAREAEMTGAVSDPLALYRMGSRPDRHTDVPYERLHARPSFDAAPIPDQPETWAGFDALELTETDLRVYHYLGQQWQAPLIFDGELNAFSFLDQLDLGWELVERTVEPDRWQAIQERRQADLCIHVVVYDDRVAASDPKDLRRASDHYGVALEAKDITEV